MGYVESVEDFKRKWVTDLLTRHTSMTQAAKEAQVARTYLWKLIKRFDIPYEPKMHYGNWGDLSDDEPPPPPRKPHNPNAWRI